MSEIKKAANAWQIKAWNSDSDEWSPRAAFIAGAAWQRERTDELDLEFEGFLKTMESINVHMGYQFTQPLMAAKARLEKIRQSFDDTKEKL